MNYEGDIIRPPSEAGSIILQATVGCSHNRCSFCGAYRTKHFHLKDEALILEDLDFASNYCQRQKTVFLADGNALAIPQQKLIHLLTLIRSKLPHVRRISLYANAQDILRRTASEMRQLKKLGLQRVYMGLETGHDPTLAAICKGSDSNEMVRAGKLVRESGMFLSVTVLLGIAGIRHSHEHALASASVLNRMKPNQIAVLTLMILDNTPLAKLSSQGKFVMPDQYALFIELRTILENLDVSRTQFQANHASNYFELDGRLPKDKKKLISIIDRALDGTVSLKPDYRRAL